MLRIELSEIKQLADSKLTVYNSISRIPFNIDLGRYTVLPETIYTRNLNESNFLEFRFDGNTRKLYNIACVSLTSERVTHLDRSHEILIQSGIFSLQLQAQDTLFFSEPVDITRYRDALLFSWDQRKKKFFRISKDVAVGVVEGDEWAALLLFDIDTSKMNAILG